MARRPRVLFDCEIALFRFNNHAISGAEVLARYFAVHPPPGRRRVTGAGGARASAGGIRAESPQWSRIRSMTSRWQGLENPALPCDAASTIRARLHSLNHAMLSELDTHLPVMRCDRDCDLCCGFVSCTATEFDDVMAFARANGIEPRRQGMTCPFYREGRCSVYTVRPFTCRLFGHVDEASLTCPRGYNTNIAAEEGHLVNISSASGLVALPWGSTYASSKWAVLGFTESIRQEMTELGHEHVAVTTVCPGYVDTGMFEGVRPPMLMPFLEPEQLVDKVRTAILKRQEMVLEPWLVKFTPLLKGILPRFLSDGLADLMGVTTGMKSWSGHSGERDD